MQSVRPWLGTVVLCSFFLSYPLVGQTTQDSSDAHQMPDSAGAQGQPARLDTGGQPRPRPNRVHRPPVRPPQWGNRPAERPSYSFRPNDRAYLHQHYSSKLARIDSARRIHLVIGGFFPWENIPQVSRLPADVYSYLPPPPKGYRIGYCEGFVVVYDPVTYYIANLIDLLP